MITIENISKTFHKKGSSFKALDSVSLEIAQSEIHGIVGFSGAGKSTLLRTLNLLERPDAGRIIVRGNDLTKISSRQLLAERKKIGMIFQHFNLLSSRNVFDNIALPLELEKRSKIEIHTKVTQLLKLVGLEDKAKEQIKSLSGGQKQRVAIARALASDPYLLLCDEATSALDAVTTQSILRLLQNINRQFGITIVMITHDLDVLQAICHQVSLIDKGKIIATGATQAVLSQENHPLIQQFIQSKTMNIPQSFLQKLEPEPRADLFPLIELELNGDITLEGILNAFNSQFKISYKILKAEIEFSGKANFGKLLFHLRGSTQQNALALNYFNQHQIKNTIKGYA